jgi:pimeloyl-ACP methyl ester carboxylesterase
MEAALAWYRARGPRHDPIEPTKVPMLFIWGDADDAVGRMSAEGHGGVYRADYTFAPLPGVGHYGADQTTVKVNELLLAHLAKHPV